MYKWRKMTAQQRAETLLERRESGSPWHSIPFRDSGEACYLLTATCFEHRPVLGHSRERMDRFTKNLISLCEESESIEQLFAFAILPNHYHLLCYSNHISSAKRDLGKLHGRTSLEWNRQEYKPGRKVWFRSVETVIKNERHFRATINYIHGNPIKHGCVMTLGDWPWSSFHDWETDCGIDTLRSHWKEYPVPTYGDGWDDFDLSEDVARLGL